MVSGRELRAVFDFPVNRKKQFVVSEPEILLVASRDGREEKSSNLMIHAAL